MLSRPNFNIRKFVSPQRRQDGAVEEGRPFVYGHDEERYFKRRPAAKQQKTSWSWMASKEPAKNSPKPIVIIRASQDIHRISHAPPLPDTPYSSKSSLCSCECRHTGQVSPPRSRSHSPPLCSVSSKTEVETWPRFSSTKNLYEDGRVSPESIWSVGDEKHISQPMAVKSSLDLEESDLPPHPGTRPGPLPTTPPPSRGAENQGHHHFGVGFLDNVQDLIRETGEAFGLAGISTPPTKPSSPASFRTDRRFADPDHQVRPLPLALQPKNSRNPRRTNPSNLKSPTRSGSIKKKKSRKDGSQKSGRRPQVPPIPKWTDNAKDLFNVRLFNRIEADEMLSRSRLEEMRLSRLSQLATRQSTETARTFETDGSETPNEPFHLQDLPSRIGAAGVSLSVPSPIQEVSTPPLFDIVRQNIPLETGWDNRVDERSSVWLQRTTPIGQQVHTKADKEESPIPAPPPKNPLRQLVRPQLPPLPAIPEVTVTNPENTILTPTSNPLAASTGEEAYVFLPCLPYTYNMPTFRQGPIRLAKADAYSSTKLAAAAAVDETLDWTAFQMAILGGAGDFFGESTDYGRRSEAEEAEIDDICEWFDSFGFEGHGELIVKTTSSSKAPSPSLSTPDMSIAGKDNGDCLPIPVEHEHPHGFWNQGKFDATRFYSAQSFGVKRWSVEGHPKRRQGGSLSIPSNRRESVDSLPQSPMPDLSGGGRGGKGSSDEPVEVVPMGYNLSHDLGDFLKWETEHACAMGFFGQDVSDDEI